MMKINMQFIALALALLFLNVNGHRLRTVHTKGTIRIEPVRLEQSGEFLHIDLDVIMDDVKVKSARGVDFIPQLISSTTTAIFREYLLKDGMSIWPMNAGYR